ncbi:MAG: diacylglycerol kinase family lipid kinase [Gudongella sp.]|nr:diacylglycerol kinase family lipid kinase [Gudongella sp.]
MRKSAMIIINPSSGKERAADFEVKIRKAIGKGYENLEVRHTEGKWDASRYAKEAGEKGFQLVVALGGDGTVNETVNGLAGFDDPPVLGIVPMGTVNDLARALHIPLDPEDAIDLLKDGDIRRIDVAVANDRYYTNTLAIGKIPSAIHNVDSDEKSRLGPLAYFIASARELAKDASFRVSLSMDDGSWKGDIEVLAAGLLDTIGGFREILPKAHMGDGMLNILVFKKLDILEAIKISPSVLMGKLEDKDIIEYFRSKTLHISTSAGISIESDVDGEKGPDLPLKIEVLPGKLRVITGRVED